MYWYRSDGKGEWVIVSKGGVLEASKELCGQGAVCNAESIGTMYVIRRSN